MISVLKRLAVTVATVAAAELRHEIALGVRYVVHKTGKTVKSKLDATRQ
jgi:hypothetical protein